MDDPNKLHPAYVFDFYDGTFYLKKKVATYSGFIEGENNFSARFIWNFIKSYRRYELKFRTWNLFTIVI